jgi:hypothetical protein
LRMILRVSGAHINLEMSETGVAIAVMRELRYLPNINTDFPQMIM